MFYVGGCLRWSVTFSDPHPVTVWATEYTCSQVLPFLVSALLAYALFPHDFNHPGIRPRPLVPAVVALQSLAFNSYYRPTHSDEGHIHTYTVDGSNQHIYHDGTTVGGPEGIPKTLCYCGLKQKLKAEKEKEKDRRRPSWRFWLKPDFFQPGGPIILSAGVAPRPLPLHPPSSPVSGFSSPNQTLAHTHPILSLLQEINNLLTMKHTRRLRTIKSVLTMKHTWRLRTIKSEGLRPSAKRTQAHPPDLHTTSSSTPSSRRATRPGSFDT